MITESLVFIYVTLFTDSKILSAAVDFFVPIYTILAFLAIVVFARRFRAKSQHSRVYSVAKKTKPTKSMNWQQKFIGTWEKTGRTDFKDYLIFMRKVPKFAAPSIAKWLDSQPLSTIIAFQDDTEKVMKIDTIGKGSLIEQCGPWVEIGGNSVAEVYVDDELNYEKIEWIEDEEKLIRIRECPSGKYTVRQERTMPSDHKMELTVITTREDSSSNTFKVSFKRSSY